MKDAQIAIPIPYDAIRAFCERNDIRRLALFGSVLREGITSRCRCKGHTGIGGITARYYTEQSAGQADGSSNHPMAVMRFLSDLIEFGGGVSETDFTVGNLPRKMADAGKYFKVNTARW